MTTTTTTDRRDSGVMRRETAAYWFATGAGADHDTAWKFGQAHKAQAAAYWIHETLTMLPSVPDAWEKFSRTL